MIDARRAPRHLAILLLAACGAACGGGGGGDGVDPGPVDAFAGTWHYAGYLGELAPPNPATMTADFGSATADGAGGFTLVHRQSENSVVGGTTTDTGLTYALGIDGALTWTLAPGATQPALGGALSDNERYGLLSTITEFSVPSLRVLIRRSGTFSLASLSGDYHTVSLGFVDPSDTGYVGTTAFDAVGGAASSGTTNREGLHQSSTSSSTYTVTPEGDLTVAGTTIVLQGGIAAGGDVAVASGGTTTGQSTALRLYVRSSSAASLLSFAGRYEVVGFLTSDTGHGTIAGELQADGAGGWTATFVVKTLDGTTEAPTSQEVGSYTVGPDGRFTLKFGAFPTLYEGGLSPDGAFAVAGGPLNAASDPLLWVLIRR